MWHIKSIRRTYTAPIIRSYSISSTFCTEKFILAWQTVEMAWLTYWVYFIVVGTIVALADRRRLSVYGSRAYCAVGWILGTFRALVSTLGTISWLVFFIYIYTYINFTILSSKYPFGHSQKGGFILFPLQAVHLVASSAHFSHLRWQS